MSEELSKRKIEITLKEAVELELAAAIANDAELEARLQRDPATVIKPIIAELLGDDGGIDLSRISTSVHIEDDHNLHFVVNRESADREPAEVAGFSLGDPIGLMDMPIGMDAIGLGVKPVKPDPYTRRACSRTTHPDTATTHRNCNSKKMNGCQHL